MAQAEKWATEWAGRHVVATCYGLLRDLSATCTPRLARKRPHNSLRHNTLRAASWIVDPKVAGSSPVALATETHGPVGIIPRGSACFVFQPGLPDRSRANIFCYPAEWPDIPALL
jgi:hypothetical protein